MQLRLTFVRPLVIGTGYDRELSTAQESHRSDPAEVVTSHRHEVVDSKLIGDL